MVVHMSKVHDDTLSPTCTPSPTSYPLSASSKETPPHRHLSFTNSSTTSPPHQPSSTLIAPPPLTRASSSPTDIDTDVVLIYDNDKEVDIASMEFMFCVWENNYHRLIGLFTRLHGLDLNWKEWIYMVHLDRYSIVLTKFMLVRSEYLYLYMCRARVRM
ncbi:hypothetical protein RJT34_16575 [Clitoria ternatea]|uniref:Glycosyl transferase 64 domain-containing protein n=1 Tax=Clitoria ternatea TaxID=43366 RepID=A0AAN9PDT8_CLITE